MKKVLITGVLGVFVLGMASCGHTTCDAFRTADYTKYKAEKTERVVIATNETAREKK